MEEDFLKGQSDNLPRVDSLMVAQYFMKNQDFTTAEIRGIKMKSEHGRARRRMSALLCCRPRAPSPPSERVMGAALSQEGSACEAAGAPAAPPTMADVIRERKKKAGGAALGTLRRRIAAAARRPRDQRPDRGCEHARYIRSVVSSWRLPEVFLLRAELEAGAALRDLSTQAELARPPAPALNMDLCSARRWLCDVELAGCGWTLPAHRALLAARCTHLRLTLPRYPSFSRVPLSGYLAECGREAMAAALRSVYAGTDTASKLCASCSKWERGAGSENDLDVLSTENTSNTWAGSDARRCRCGRAVPDPAVLRRLQQALGFTPDAPATLSPLRASGEYADCRLSFPRAGPAADLPAHKFILGARSRLFRKVLSGGGASSSAGVISIDEGVLPRRFAKALLHAAYTDQVDLNLIGRGSTSPPSTNSSVDGNSSWPGRSGSSSRSNSSTQLEDAFQLYEIARFCEMPILAQGCEDAIAAMLSPATLPGILQWSQATHASQWVHRQAMRYLLDEFPACLAAPAAAALPAAPLAAALQHPHLQCSELQALRAVLRWGAKLKRQQEPNVVWHTTHSVSRLGLGGGAAGARAGAAALREAVAPLVSRVRLEHIPPGNELLQQAIRRGIVCQPPSLVQPGCSADAWLARGPHRPPRCFLPYLDEIKALLEGQIVPEAELARVRRTRYMHRIPDTLYMVSAELPAPPPAPPPAALAPPPPALRALRRRARELRQAPAATTALHAAARAQAQLQNVYRQVALRAVREMALPDECAELLLTDLDEQEQTDRESSWEECDEAAGRDIPDRRPDCCRSGSAAASSQGSLRCASVNSDQPSVSDKERSSLCRRRELPALVAEGQPHRTDSLSRCCVSGTPRACVPDVACTRAPNGNTHLLPERDYRAPSTHANFSGLGVLQLDLGDGATHTPRPGSRALRAATQSARQHREPQQMSSVRRPPSDDDELRAAIEMSVIRAYSSSSYSGRARAASPPPAPRPRPPQHHTHTYSAARSARLTPSPVSLTASSSAHLSLRGESSRESAGTPSPRRHYRLEPSSYGGGSSHSSRGASPNNYA